MKRYPFVRIRNPLFFIMNGGRSSTGTVPSAGWKMQGGFFLQVVEKACFPLVFPFMTGWNGENCVTLRTGRGSGQDDSFHGIAEGLVTELLQGMLQEALCNHSACCLFRNAA